MGIVKKSPSPEKKSSLFAYGTISTPHTPLRKPRQKLAHGHVGTHQKRQVVKAVQRVRIATEADTARSVKNHWCHGPTDTTQRRVHPGLPKPGVCHLPAKQARAKKNHPLSEELEAALDSSTSPIADRLQSQIMDISTISLAHVAAAGAGSICYLQHAARIRNTLGQVRKELSSDSAELQQLLVSSLQKLAEMWKKHAKLNEKLTQLTEELVTLDKQSVEAENEKAMQGVTKEMNKLGKEWISRAAKMEMDFEDELKKKRELATAAML